MSIITLGRIVLYRASGPEQVYNGTDLYPAIVTQIFGDGGVVNLTCFPPVVAPFPEFSVEHGEGPRMWRWPPRS